MQTKKNVLAGLTSVVVAALLGAASLAHATETSRAEYVAAVEPICKANTEANEKILKGVRAEVKAGKLGSAGRQFAKATIALKKTIVQLRAVPQPAADAPRLAKWLRYLGSEASLFEATTKKLKEGNKLGAEAMVVRLEHTANLANNVAVPFEFEYCRFEPSRFT